MRALEEVMVDFEDDAIGAERLTSTSASLRLMLFESRGGRDMAERVRRGISQHRREMR